MFKGFEDDLEEDRDSDQCYSKDEKWQIGTFQEEESPDDRSYGIGGASERGVDSEVLSEILFVRVLDDERENGGIDVAHPDSDREENGIDQREYGV